MSSNSVSDHHENQNTESLKQTIVELMDLLEKQNQILHETKEKLVEKSKKPNLSLYFSEEISIKPKHDQEEYDIIRKKLKILKAKCMQINLERETADLSTQNTIQQLKAENEELKSNLDQLRHIYPTTELSFPDDTISEFL